MKTIISKKLASVLPIREEIKINNISYLSGVNFTGMKLDESDKDYTINLNASEFNYFCFNKNNKITCWPVSKGEQPINDSGQWKKEGRQEIKPGKFLLLFTDYFLIKDTDNYNLVDDPELRDKIIRRTCEIFTDKIKGSNEELNFDISSNVSEIYETDSHSDSGYLLSSCMRPDSGYDCKQYSGFYDLVPGLQIVYKKIGDTLLFRSLLWSCITDDGKEIKFLDRIYGSDKTNLQLIEKAKENGWAWRNFSDSCVHLNDIRVNISCKINQESFNYLEESGSPYVDTLTRLTESGSDFILSNYKRYDYELTSCDGTAVSNHCVCESCGDRLSEDDTYHNDNGDIYCQSCFDDHYFYCSHCSEVCDNDDMVSTDIGYYCEDCARNLGYDHCEHCGQWEKDCICVDDCYYCEECYNDKFSYCEHCEEDKPQDEFSNITVDGEEVSICNDCKEELHKCSDCENYFTDELNDDNLCPDCAEKIEANKDQLVLTFNE